MVSTAIGEDHRASGRRPIDAWFGEARVTVVRESARLVGAPGASISLLPIHGAAA